MKVLVTGATGFIGGHLVKKLIASGHQVRALVRRNMAEPFLLLYGDSVEIAHGDVTNAVEVRDAVKETDAVFHLAALLGRWQVQESEYHRVNVHGTQVLIEECLDANVNHFIFLSTTGVMGRLKTIPADSNHPCSPTTLYEISKYQAELLVREIIRTKDFPATIIRPTHVYGPGDKNTVKLLKAIKSSRIFPLIDGGRRLFQPIYVEDLVEALVLCAEKDEATARKLYIIAGDETLTFKDFINLSAHIMNSGVMTLSIPESLAFFLSNISEGVGAFLNNEPTLTRSRVEFFTRDHVYDSTKICKDIGFAPRVDVKTGLQRTIKWYEDNGWL